MLWGATLRPGETFTRVVHHPEYLSLASLECRPSKNNGELHPSSYLLLHIDGEEQMLCMLQKGSVPQQKLDLHVTQTLTFSVEGTGIVYLTGYSSGNSLQLHRDVPPQLETSTTAANDTPGQNQRAKREPVSPEKQGRVHPCTKNRGIAGDGPTWERDLPVMNRRDQSREVASVDQEDPGGDISWNIDIPKLDQPSSPFSDELDNIDDMNRDAQGYLSDIEDIGDESFDRCFRKTSTPMEDSGEEEEDMWVLASSDDEKDQNETENFDDDNMTITPATHWQKDGECRWSEDSILKEVELKEDERADTGPSSGGSNKDQHYSTKRKKTVRNSDQGVALSDQLTTGEKCFPVKSDPAEMNLEDSNKDSLEITDGSNRNIKHSLSLSIHHSPKYGNALLKDKDDLKLKSEDKSYKLDAKTTKKDASVTPKEPERTANDQLKSDPDRTGQSSNSVKITVMPNTKISTPNRKNVYAGSRALFPCQYCSMTFAFNHSLGEHELTHSAQLKKQSEPAQDGGDDDDFVVSVDVFVCQRCHKVFETQELLATHQKTHDSEEPPTVLQRSATKQHKCPSCEKEYVRKDSLDKHMREVHGVEVKSQFRCDPCWRNFRNRVGFLNHMKIHSKGKRTLKSNFCRKNVAKSFSSEHVRSHSAEGPFSRAGAASHKEGENHSSDLAETSKESLNRTTAVHSTSATLASKAITAGRAGNPTDTAPVIKASLSGMSTDVRGTSSIRKYGPCTYCGKAFKQKSHLVEHIRCHTGEKPFQCDLCKTAFRTASSVRAHQRKVHKCSSAIGMVRKRAVNKLSGRNINSLAVKKRCTVKVSRLAMPHSLSQTVGDPLPSPARRDTPLTEESSSINVTTARPTQLSVNGNGSTGERTPHSVNSFAGDGLEVTQPQSAPPEITYVCGFCSMSFKSKPKLWKHTQTHSDESHWSCSFCERQYTTQAAFDIHVRSHTGERPFRCSFCHKRFFRKSHLVRHELIHKGKTKTN